MTPFAAAQRRFAEHFSDFGLAFNRDGLQPRLAQPVKIAVLLEFVVAKRHVLNDTSIIED